MPRPDRSRAALVQSAATLFRRQGFAATGVNQILEAADVKAGSLYHHFPDGKAELAAEVVEQVGGGITRLLRTQLDGDRSPATVVGQWIDMLADGLRGDQRDGCPIEPMATESIHASPVLRAASARAFAGWAAVIAERLVADGWSDDDADRTAQSIIALIEGALILSRVAGNRSALDAAKSASTILLSTN